MDLALADTKHLGPADWARTLSGGSSVLQGNALRVTDLSLGPALEAICLHEETSLPGIPETIYCG